ncbi:thioredoxin [Candidatus Riesia pediculicola USDA]|uniref:Thioredoxin n=2 Tax=Candidatus Riesia pediculicola TaxID=401619 RepID=D4G842_RIEPU|nr:thioredoxin [Candidatus Riesia pediculicola USDA]ARC53747.1 thioredoxin [Candidatus Riesia pediculicola]
MIDGIDCIKTFSVKEMKENLLSLSDSNFEEYITNSRKVILVDFWAPWCTPCKNMHDVIKNIKNEYLEKISITTLNVEENFKTSSKYDIRSIPTLIIFKKGKEVERIVGSISMNQLEQFIERNT